MTGVLTGERRPVKKGQEPPAAEVISLHDLVSESALLREFPGLFSRRTLKAMRKHAEIRFVEGDEETFYPRKDLDRVVTNLLRGEEPPCPVKTLRSSTKDSGLAESGQTGLGIAIGGKDAASAGAALAKRI
jgi:hypothetical protein